MYLERLSIFDYTNNEYYAPNGTFNTYSSKADIAMPNCTIYCWLRMHEATDQNKVKQYWIRDIGGFGNAKTWYDTTTLPKGSELRDGCIAVFDGNCGHVVFVERATGKDTAIITESNYDENKSLRNEKFWRQREVKLEVGKATLSGVGKLKGFIYLPINDIRTSKNVSKEQIEVLTDYINVRTGAGLNYEPVLKGAYAPKGVYDVLDTKEADGYTWYKLEKDHWIAGVKDVIYYPVVDSSWIVYEDMKKIKEIADKWVKES